MISADAPSGSRALDRMSVGESDNVGIANRGFGNKFVGTSVLAFEDSVVKGSVAGHKSRLQMQLVGRANTRAHQHAGCPRLFSRNNMRRTPCAIGGLMSAAVLL
jgi:hypothetical protein